MTTSSASSSSVMSPSRLVVALLLACASPAAAWLPGAPGAPALSRSLARQASSSSALLHSHTAPAGVGRRAPAARMAGDPGTTSVSKAALVDAIALKAGVSKKTASLVLGATLDVIVDSVCEKHKVSLVGFGTFSAKERPEREARNPKTGEKMTVKAATVPSFSFGKSFKDAVKAYGTGGEFEGKSPSSTPPPAA